MTTRFRHAAWPYPFPPMAGGEGEHQHADDTPPEEIVRETGDAIEDALEAAEHAPHGAAEIPHDLHEELATLRERHVEHQNRLTDHDSTLALLQGENAELRGVVNELGARVDALATVPVETAKEEVPPALEMPEEIIAPRKIHPVRAWSRGRFRIF